MVASRTATRCVKTPLPPPPPRTDVRPRTLLVLFVYLIVDWFKTVAGFVNFKGVIFYFKIFVSILLSLNILPELELHKHSLLQIMDPSDNYQKTYENKTKTVVFYSQIRPSRK